MAFPAPAAVFLDENLPIHRGKRADGLNARPLKPSAKPSARKALRDVSNTSKPQAPSIQKGHPLKDRSVLKDKSALRSQEAIKKNPLSKTTIYADEATKKCHEWAKGGVEGTHFTGNDAQRLDSDKIDKRVKKKVEKITSALHDWSDVIFDPLLFPAKAVAPFYEEVNVLELEPEILPDISGRLSISGDKAKLTEDSFDEVELDCCSFLEDKPVEFQLRDEISRYPWSLESVN
ncbi:hypothetical protein CFC21_092757 [Triticum aestivum]|nr:uncharacterized protein LOC109758575 [Aegilops tauschii subsp. strangulata]XP_020173029.1 uncharacterized protein LOC109758575 [Aegilops tauschii subsp. strangulata]XP_044419914.1 uncharacterized protein LOC123144755 [Triticum aestivum]XP_044419915.1 uncharacterized protein LOC123144755 [Triticum aestivum]KAF7089904.1 hypothetical protein CFC21_092757 [Triticum aestivum]